MGASWLPCCAAGRRETGPELLTELDEVGRAIMTRSLDPLNGKVAIPTSLRPAMQLGPALGNLVAVAGGDTEAAGRARQFLEAMAESSDLASLATVLYRILDGDRDPILPRSSPRHRQGDRRDDPSAHRPR